jgi:hypothetical protein
MFSKHIIQHIHILEVPPKVPVRTSPKGATIPKDSRAGTANLIEFLFDQSKQFFYFESFLFWFSFKFWFEILFCLQPNGQAI